MDDLEVLSDISEGTDDLRQPLSDKEIQTVGLHDNSSINQESAFLKL